MLLRHTKGIEELEKYEYDSDGNCVYEKTTQYGDVSYCEYTYTNGVLTSSYEEYEGSVDVDDDIGTHSVPAYSYYYTDFDYLGRPVKMQCFEYNEDPYTDVYSYSADSKTISTYYLPKELGYVFTVRYDSAGRIILKEHISEYSEDYYWRHEYKYDGLTCMDSYYSARDKLEYTQVFESDENGNLVSETHYDPEGNLTASWKYEYDDHNMITRQTKYYDGAEEISFGPERQYYDNGQIKEMICYDDVEYIAPVHYLSPPTAAVSEGYF